MKRFVYFYFNRSSPELPRVVPSHVRYWATAGVDDYLGGPFADRTGGLISFRASDLEAAHRLVREDPFARQDLIAEGWLKEWIPEEPPGARR